MNLRQFSIALLISALPLTASANSSVTLTAGDFRSAKQIKKGDRTILAVKLSKSGKAKLKRMNMKPAGNVIHVDETGISSDFKVKVPIEGTDHEMGPYTLEDAKKVVSKIKENKA